MREKVMRVVCDRCGKEILLKKEKADTVVDTFEQLPEGWKVMDGNDLCPECADKYMSMIKGFYNKR